MKPAGQAGSPARTQPPRYATRPLHAAWRTQRDRAAVLRVQTAAAIFRARLLVSTAAELIANIAAWRDYRRK